MIPFMMIYFPAYKRGDGRPAVLPIIATRAEIAIGRSPPSDNFFIIFAKVIDF
jgi:hypothetical protein